MPIWTIVFTGSGFLAALDEIGQRRTLDQLHRDIRMSAFVADIEYGDDVRMREHAGALRLAQEPYVIFRIAAQLRLQHLDRQRAVDVRVVGLEHLGHRALADLVADLVATYLSMQRIPSFYPCDRTCDRHRKFEYATDTSQDTSPDSGHRLAAMWRCRMLPCFREQPISATSPSASFRLGLPAEIHVIEMKRETGIESKLMRFQRFRVHYQQHAIKSLHSCPEGP
jgi:hypothetical protein